MEECEEGAWAEWVGEEDVGGLEGWGGEREVLGSYQTSVRVSLYGHNMI